MIILLSQRDGRSYHRPQASFQAAVNKKLGVDWEGSVSTTPVRPLKSAGLFFHVKAELFHRRPIVDENKIESPLWVFS
jgi:hypothetical protein